MKHITFATHHPRTLKISGTKQIFIGLVLAVAFMAAPRTLLAAGPAPVNLRSAAHFTILAASTTTTVGEGIINGDVGLFPVGSQGIPPARINGTIYNGDTNGVAAQAQLDLTAAIIAASPAQSDRIVYFGLVRREPLRHGSTGRSTTATRTGSPPRPSST